MSDTVSNFIHITQNETKYDNKDMGFLTKGLEKDGKMETNRIFATRNGLDTENSGNMSVQKLRDHVYGKIQSSGVDKESRDSIYSEWAHEFCNLGDGEVEIEIEEVLSWFARKQICRIESLRKMKDLSSSKRLTK